MAAVVCVPNGDFDFSSAKRLRYSKSPPPSAAAASILRQKRSFVEDVQFPSPSPAKKIRFGDHEFRREEASTQPVKLPTSKVEWVEAMIKEMMGSASVDDAKSRAAGLFECLEKFIAAGMAADSEAAAREFQEKIETLAKENSVLKRGVAIQHQRQKEYENNNEEVKQLKELVGKYQEKVKSLEMNNYALTMHLHQALCSNPIPVRFPPEVF